MVFKFNWKDIAVITSLVCALAWANQVSAYEVDNFTDRDHLHQDAQPLLDAKVNKILDRAVIESRIESRNYCSMAVLRQEILRWIRPDPTGQIEVWIELSDEIDHTHAGISQSIYQDVTFFEAPILRMVGIGRSLILANEVVGSDKIGHFFYQGLSYFDLVKDGKPLEKVLAEDHGEDGIWGLSTSGVKSYADMAANYQGYRFWSQLISGPNPYVKCDEKLGWVKVRNFTWADYVNPAWDEALNCSEFRPAIQKRVEAYLTKKNWQCPMKPERCSEISKLDHAEFFLSPKCKIEDKQVITLNR